MAAITRFSSRRQRLDRAFLARRLKDARSYRRTGDYFRSSIFELVGEEIADYVAKELETFRPGEASAARVLREIVKNQRL